MSTQHRKPLAAFIVLMFLAAGVVAVQRADAQAGRLLAAAVGTGVRVHGALPAAPAAPATTAGPAFDALADPSSLHAPGAWAVADAVQGPVETPGRGATSSAKDRGTALPAALPERPASPRVREDVSRRPTVSAAPSSRSARASTRGPAARARTQPARVVPRVSQAPARARVWQHPPRAKVTQRGTRSHRHGYAHGRTHRDRHAHGHLRVASRR